MAPSLTARAPVPSPAQLIFVAEYMRTRSVAVSSKAAGVSQKMGSYWLEQPEVRNLLQASSAQITKAVAYEAEDAMLEAEDAIAFAKQTKNANALVKAIELRAKLKGLLIEKIDARLLGGFSIKIAGIDDAPFLRPEGGAPAFPTSHQPIEAIAAQVVAALPRPKEDEDEEEEQAQAEMADATADDGEDLF